MPESQACHAVRLPLGHGGFSKSDVTRVFASQRLTPFHAILTLLVAGSWLPLLVAGGLFTTPPDISRSNGPIFRMQTAFDSTQRDLHF